MTASPFLWGLYRMMTGLALGSAIPYYLVKGCTDRRWREMLRGRLALGTGGDPEPPVGQPFWLHAVSVGEVRALRAVVERLRRDAPHLAVVVSASTPTGHTLAREIMPETVAVVYFPFDTPGCIRRAMTRIRPRAVAVMETEIWPFFYRCCREKRIPLALINGRMSERSLSRYSLIPSLFREIMDCVELGLFQTEQDRERFSRLGLSDSRTMVSGNLKYDLENMGGLAGSGGEGASLVAAWRRQRDTDKDGLPRPLVVAGSTKPGEEEMILAALEPLMNEYPELLLLIAPRHPRRFQEVDRLLDQCPLPHQSRSKIKAGDRPASGCRIMLLDTLGELAGVYGESSVAFVGGSLVPEGGHNILEPAFFRKPILFGPHMDNFSDVASLFLEREAAIQLESPPALGPVLERLLNDERLRMQIGARARTILEENQGAAAATSEQLLRLAVGERAADSGQAGSDQPRR